MRRSFFTSPLLLAIVLAAALPRTAAADAIISNDGSLVSGHTAADASVALRSSYMAVGFTINAGSTYTFSDAIAYGINIAGGSSSGTTTYNMASLWMGDSGQPATLVQNLTTSSISGTTYTFTPSSAITLTGGDTYWLVITATRRTFQWGAAVNTPTGPGASYVQAGQGMLSGSASSPSVTSYAHGIDSNDAGGSGGTGASTYSAGFKIDGTPQLSAAPEPGSLALLGSVAGVVALGGWWKRRRGTVLGEPGASATGAPQ